MKPESPGGKVIQLEDGIFLIPGRKAEGCNIFVLKGSRRVALIDVGMPNDHDLLCSSLTAIGLSIDDVSMVILTHEHIDHVGGLHKLPQRVVVAAHARAANKLRLDDDFSVMNSAFGTGKIASNIDIHLEDGTLIDLGGIRLRTIYTPGHCSGAICLYEPERGAMFTSDTIFAGGILGGIFASGNISDYINSLERLREFRMVSMYPGHGGMSSHPADDLERAIKGSLLLLGDTRSLFQSINVKGAHDQFRSATGMYSRRAAERRENVRMPTTLGALVHLGDADHPVGVRNLSLTGARLDREIAMAKGASVRLTLDTIGEIECEVIAHVAGHTHLKVLASSPAGELLAGWLSRQRADTKRRR